MSLNIGGVSFGVDAQTAGLTKALMQLQRFEKTVNAIAKSQSQGATSTVNAMARQESAVKKALQQTVAMRQEALKLKETLDKVKSSDPGIATLKQQNIQQLASISKAFTELTTRMTKGKLTTLEYTRAMDAFNIKALRNQRALNDMKRAQDAAASSGSKLTNIFRQMESATVLAVGPLSGLGARIRSLSAIMSRGTVIAALFFGGIAAGSMALGSFTSAVIRSGVEFEKAMARFQAASGSQAVAARDMLFVINTSKEMGLRIQDNIKSYSRLTAASQNTSLQGVKIKNVFRGISTAAAALKMDTLEVEGVFRAVEQMISKGNVQAEELRGQLGERLPGAFRLAAEAMGVTTSELDKMLKNGEVVAEDFLPKFAALLEKTFGAAAQQNVNSFNGALNRIQNAWFILTAQTDQQTKASAAAIYVMNKFASVLEWMAENTETIAKVLGIATGALGGFIARMAILTGGAMLLNIGKLVMSFGSLTKILAMFNITAMANPGMRLAQGILTLTAVVGGAVYGMKQMEEIMKDVDSLMGDLANTAALAGPDLEGTFPGATVDATKFRRELDMMGERIEAMKQGPQALDIFEGIDAPIIEFRQALEDAGISGQLGIDLLWEYGRKTREIYELQQRMSDVARQSAQAITNGLEDIIVKGENAKDTIKGLIAELIRMGIRAAVLDPLTRGMSGMFSKLNFPVMGAKAGGGSVRAGGTYRVNERGDELFTPSVNGSITPAHKLGGGGGGGGGVSVTIHAPGADAGTIGRIREMVVTEMVPQIVAAATRNTMNSMKRPRFS